MTQILGGCLCGAVRFQLAAEPVMTAICHCTHCQRQSGGAFSVNIGIPRGSLKFTAGTPATFEDQGDSGLPVHRHFCARCGSPIVSVVEATPGLDWLKAGTLDDTSWVKPQVAIWCQSAQPWVSLPSTIAQFPQNPPSA
ncbi:GFA family protein [Ideonella sp. A 288]|uniref:GFA family protein n=1 Tax=Ideonella sp. A 288 TaxID=1962181 RepID=UPI000B4AE80B|nr:GFA family protein [Ideonella sp. A 288]